jgi:glucokinase
MAFLGLDLGGSHANCSLIHGKSVVASEHIAFADSSSLVAVLPEITHCLARLANKAPARVEGLGIGICALVDSSANRVLSTNGKYDDTREFDFAAWSQKSLQMPVRLENDARLALRGEMYAGAGRGIGDVVMFTLGTGIGGVAAMGGHPLLGVHGQAGVLSGHVPVRMDGRPCSCGGHGCAESEASGWALPLICKEWPGFADSLLSTRPLNFKELFDCCAVGDPVAKAVRDHCLKVWGMMSVAAVHSFDPEIIIFGGGVMGAAAEILPHVQKYVDENTWTPWGKVGVVAAALGSEAAALGVPTLFAEDDRPI